jgi:6-phosphogluconate dehydrogenase
MKLGLVGLGRMGAGLGERLVRAGHQVVGFDRGAAALARAAEKGVAPARSLPELARELATPRVVWLMIPAGEAVDDALGQLLAVCAPGDIVIDGGNSYYRDTVRRAAMLEEAGVHLVDVGTSGGVWGPTEGYSLMVGGARDVVERLRPVFEALAPGAARGWGHVGLPGAGHFVKMVHNGIEYGLMQAYAEGFALLKRKGQFDLDVHQIAEIWRSGSVVRSWLLDLCAHALEADADLADLAPVVADSGYIPEPGNCDCVGPGW